MESDNQNNNTPAPNPHQHGGPPPQGEPRAREQWDSTVDTRALWVVLAVAGLLAVIVFGFSMCARVAGGPGPAFGDGYDVLQQRVGEAFDSNDRQPAGGIGQNTAQPTASETRSAAQPPRMNDGDGSAAPDQRLMQDMEQQRRIMQQQEQMRDEQREAVPSILPEKPPRPVPLGGDNY